MEKEISVVIDRTGDTIDIWFTKPRKAVVEEIEEDFLIKRDEKTREIVGIEICNAGVAEGPSPIVKTWVVSPSLREILKTPSLAEVQR